MSVVQERRGQVTYQYVLRDILKYRDSMFPGAVECVYL